MSTQIHSIIRDRKEIKTTALSIRRGVDKQAVIYAVGVLFSLNRREIPICVNLSMLSETSQSRKHKYL